MQKAPSRFFYREVYRGVTPRPMTAVDNYKMIVTPSPIQSSSSFQHERTEAWRHSRGTPVYSTRTPRKIYCIYYFHIIANFVMHEVYFYVTCFREESEV